VIEGRSPSADRHVERALAENLGKPFDTDRLEHDMGTAYSDGRFQQVDYRLVERDGVRGLQIIPANKPWSAFGKIGFQLDDDFNGNSSYLVSAELTFNDINTLGGESRNVMRLGRITGVRSEFYQPFGQTGDFYLQPWIELRNESLPLWEADNQLAEFRVNRRMAGLGSRPLAAARMAGQRAACSRTRSRRPADRQSGGLRDHRGVFCRVDLRGHVGHARQRQFSHQECARQHQPGGLSPHDGGATSKAMSRVRPPIGPRPGGATTCCWEHG
jgi:hypothetical protein